MGDFVLETYERIRKSAATSVNVPAKPFPSQETLAKARASLPQPSDSSYLCERGYQDTLDHLFHDIVPGLNGSSRTTSYWGGVATGGVLPIAEMADNMVTAFDQDVVVSDTVAHEVEDAALEMLMRLFGIGSREDWEGRCITTGSAAGNILGLTCGRDEVVRARLTATAGSGGGGGGGVGDLGLLDACAQAGIKKIQILADPGHSSLEKAAAITGLGRHAVKTFPTKSGKTRWRLDIDALEKELKKEGVASIIAVSFGDVLTGRFATTGIKDMRRLRELADKHRAWLHVDGSFGIYARALPEEREFSRLKEYAAGLELADSITADLHSLLNVPYDTGVFFTRKASVLQSACKNGGEAPWAMGAVDSQSPRNIGLENSRRFRALPVYAVLLCEGKTRIGEMVARMVRLARLVCEGISSSRNYTLVPDKNIDETSICVLYQAKDESLNEKFLDIMEGDQVWKVSRVEWKGKVAARMAVASWKVNVPSDYNSVMYHLEMMHQDHKHGPWRR